MATIAKDLQDMEIQWDDVVDVEVRFVEVTCSLGEDIFQSIVISLSDNSGQWEP